MTRLLDSTEVSGINPGTGAVQVDMPHSVGNREAVVTTGGMEAGLKGTPRTKDSTECSSDTDMVQRQCMADNISLGI